MAEYARLAAKFTAALLSGSLLFATQTVAAESTRMVLQMTPGVVSGHLQNGTRLGSGVLIGGMKVPGFQISGDTSLAARVSASGHYVLTGRNSPTHRLSVVLVADRDSQVLPTQSNNALGLTAREGRADFLILADGDQTIIADRYLLILKGEAMTLMRQNE